MKRKCVLVFIISIMILLLCSCDSKESSDTTASAAPIDCTISEMSLTIPAGMTEEIDYREVLDTVFWDIIEAEKQYYDVKYFYCDDYNITITSEPAPDYTNDQLENFVYAYYDFEDYKEHSENVTVNDIDYKIVKYRQGVLYNPDYNIFVLHNEIFYDINIIMYIPDLPENYLEQIINSITFHHSAQGTTPISCGNLTFNVPVTYHKQMNEGDRKYKDMVSFKQCSTRPNTELYIKQIDDTGLSDDSIFRYSETIADAGSATISGTKHIYIRSKESATPTAIPCTFISNEETESNYTATYFEHDGFTYFIELYHMPYESQEYLYNLVRLVIEK